jgi:hypothetical protein
LKIREEQFGTVLLASHWLPVALPRWHIPDRTSSPLGAGTLGLAHRDTRELRAFLRFAWVLLTDLLWEKNIADWLKISGWKVVFLGICLVFSLSTLHTYTNDTNAGSYKSKHITRCLYVSTHPQLGSLLAFFPLMNKQIRTCELPKGKEIVWNLQRSHVVSRRSSKGSGTYWMFRKVTLFTVPVWMKIAQEKLGPWHKPRYSHTGYKLCSPIGRV